MVPFKIKVLYMDTIGYVGHAGSDVAVWFITKELSLKYLCLDFTCQVFG